MSRMQNRTAWRRAFQEWCRKHPDLAPPKTTIGYADILFHYANSDGTITRANLAGLIEESHRWKPSNTRKHLRWFKRNGWLINVGRACEGTFQRRGLALPPGLDVYVDSQHSEALAEGKIRPPQTTPEGGTHIPPSEPERGVHTYPLEGGTHIPPDVVNNPSVNSAGASSLSTDAVLGTQGVRLKVDAKPTVSLETAPAEPENDHPAHATLAAQVAHLKRLEAEEAAHADAADIIDQALTDVEAERREMANLAHPPELQPEDQAVNPQRGEAQ